MPFLLIASAWAPYIYTMKLSYEDLAEVVRNNRNFDLLVVGLQEVPRHNISRLLQEALLESYV